MKRKIIAFYLPQYYPTNYNDKWWGKGFTEWTNVGKAKALYKGHYQPKVPTELGYYDLRVEETRIKQAALANEYGISGFCYWHYWFAGKRVLNDVFDEVVNSGTPNFPFCLCWANHSWYKKTWTSNGKDELLLEQTYPGESDYIIHFNTMLKAFKDSRYMRTDDGRLIFGIFAPQLFTDFPRFKKTWNKLATQHGLKGFYFLGYTSRLFMKAQILTLGFDAIIEDYVFSGMKWDSWSQLIPRIKKYLLKIPKLSDYNAYIDTIMREYNYEEQSKLCILPNFDHSPRSGLKRVIYGNSSPVLWKKLLSYIICDLKYNDLLFIKAWNEWGEGNYLEPDIKYGRGFLEAIKDVIDEEK